MNCDDRKCDQEACGNILYAELDRELGNCHACRDGIPSIVREEDEEDA